MQRATTDALVLHTRARHKVNPLKANDRITHIDIPFLYSVKWFERVLVLSIMSLFHTHTFRFPFFLPLDSVLVFLFFFNESTRVDESIVFMESDDVHIPVAVKDIDLLSTGELCAWPKT